MTQTTSDSYAVPSRTKQVRPLWLRVVIWAGMAYLLLNVFGLALFFLPNVLGGFASFFVASGGAILTIGLLLAFLRHFKGFNLFRTWGNKATADFRREDDPVRGGYLYRVRPARASLLAVLIPLPLCALLATWGVFAAWLFYAAVILYVIVASTFVLPGARYRKAVTISVSPHGIHSDDVDMPLDRISELELGYSGVRISEDPLMPGRNGVSTSAMVGRGLGRRQASRSFTLMLRGDGESRANVIAGGLTEECAINLARDINKWIEVFRHAKTKENG